MRFHKKALDCCDSLDEGLVVNVCFHGMAEEYRIFLENLSFSSFSKLIDAKRYTSESVLRSSSSIEVPKLAILPQANQHQEDVDFCGP